MSLGKFIQINTLAYIKADRRELAARRAD